MYKMKKGGSFDLNKDGKTTFKDVLIGRGVLPKTAKKGTKVKKAQNGTLTSRGKIYDEDAALKYRNQDFKTDIDTSGYSAGKKRFPVVKRSVTYPDANVTSEKTPKKNIFNTVGRKQVGKIIKKSQNGKSISMKRGRDTINITDTSGYAAGKKAGYPAQMISPKTKYSKGDTTNTTVNRKMVGKAIGKQKTGGMTKKCKYGCK